jgi:hypothetical protein
VHEAVLLHVTALVAVLLEVGERAVAARVVDRGRHAERARQVVVVADAGLPVAAVLRDEHADVVAPGRGHLEHDVDVHDGRVPGAAAAVDDAGRADGEDRVLHVLCRADVLAAGQVVDTGLSGGRERVRDEHPGESQCANEETVADARRHFDALEGKTDAARQRRRVCHCVSRPTQRRAGAFEATRADAVELIVRAAASSAYASARATVSGVAQCVSALSRTCQANAPASARSAGVRELTTPPHGAHSERAMISFMISFAPP